MDSALVHVRDLASWASEHGVAATCTSRLGGVSAPPYDANLGLHVGDEPEAVLENRRRWVAELGFDVDDLVLANQVHGATVATVSDVDRGRGARSLEGAPVADALVTATPDLVVGVLVADCLPVLLVDEDAGVLGVAHAGWRGLAAGVLARTVDAMAACRSDGSPPRLVAYVGPGISQDRFEVGPEVLDALGLGASHHAVSHHARPHVDLAAVALEQLVSLGIGPDRTTLDPRTTDDPSLFSARRATPTGRFGILAALRPVAP